MFQIKQIKIFLVIFCLVVLLFNGVLVAQKLWSTAITATHKTGDNNEQIITMKTGFIYCSPFLSCLTIRVNSATSSFN